MLGLVSFNWLHFKMNKNAYLGLHLLHYFPTTNLSLLTVQIEGKPLGKF